MSVGPLIRISHGTPSTAFSQINNACMTSPRSATDSAACPGAQSSLNDAEAFFGCFTGNGRLFWKDIDHSRMERDHHAAWEGRSCWKVSGVCQRLENEQPDERTHPPYFSTVISGKAAPRGSMLRTVRFATGASRSRLTSLLAQRTHLWPSPRR